MGIIDDFVLKHGFLDFSAKASGGFGTEVSFGACAELLATVSDGLQGLTSFEPSLWGGTIHPKFQLVAEEKRYANFFHNHP